MIQHRASQALHPPLIFESLSVLRPRAADAGLCVQFCRSAGDDHLIEPIKAEFGATDTQMGFLSGLAFALFYATLGIPVARLADDGQDAMYLPSP